MIVVVYYMSKDRTIVLQTKYRLIKKDFVYTKLALFLHLQ
jgi:hypothetical protein